jgi:hypothetical protein
MRDSDYLLIFKLRQIAEIFRKFGTLKIFFGFSVIA